MTHGFQQQDTGYGYAPPKQAATQQHGQKAAEKPLPMPRRAHPADDEEDVAGNQGTGS